MIKELVNQAYNYAKIKHEGQFRKYTKIPYFTHPKFVARVTEKLNRGDPVMIASALLHDVIEDTDSTLIELYDLFGKQVGDLVKELTNTKEERAGRSKKDYIHWKIRQMSSKALFIKLVDRYHNLLFLERDCGGDKEREGRFY